MQSLARCSPSSVEGTVRVLLLADSDKGASDVGHLWTIVDEVQKAVVRLDGCCLEVWRVFSNPSSGVEDGNVVRVISLTGDAMLHQLLLGRNNSSESAVVTKLLLGCRVGGGPKRGDGPPSEQQLVELITSHFLVCMGEQKNDDASMLLNCPQWFLYVSGDSALPVGAINDSVPKGILQQCPGVLLWFFHEPSLVACDSPSPEATFLFSEWWRNLQRTLLLPSAKSAVDRLLWCQRECPDDTFDTHLPPSCLSLVRDSNEHWHTDWNGESTSEALPLRVLSSFSRRDKGDDSVCQELSLFPTEKDEAPFPLDHRTLTEPHTFEDVSELLALNSSVGSSSNDNYSGAGKVPPQLQQEAIEKSAAHFLLFVFANHTAVDSSVPLDAAPLASQSPYVWYLQILTQHTEAGGCIVSAFGDSLQLRYTPYVHAASRFVLLPADARTSQPVGWTLHCVDCPNMVLERVVSGTRWMFLPVFLTTPSPSPCVRISSTSKDLGGGDEGIFTPDFSALLDCGEEISSKTRFRLEDVSLNKQQEDNKQSYWQLRVVSFGDTDDVLYLAASFDSQCLTALPSKLLSDKTFLPVYASITPLWRAHMATQLRRHPHCRGVYPNIRRRTQHSLFSPTSPNTRNFMFGNSFLPPSDICYIAPFTSPLGDKLENGVALRRDVPFFTVAAKSLRSEPLHVVFVGGSAVGKTTMVRWIWAWSRGWSSEDMLQELSSWFQRGGSGIEGDGAGDNDITAVLESPRWSPLSDDKTTESAQVPQSVELVVGGQTHIFVGDDAQFLLQSSAGVNNVVLHVDDRGVPFVVRVVDVPGSSSRELLRTHCTAADVVVCTVDMRDLFSLAWLEERLDVILAGSTIEKQTEADDSSTTHYMQQQQKFVFLKLNDGSPRQVIYSRDIRNFLQHAETIAGMPMALWVLWDIPCEGQMNGARRSELLYKGFVDLLQERYACRLVATAMGWEGDIVTGLQKLAYHMHRDHHVNDENDVREQQSWTCFSEKNILYKSGCKLPILSVMLLDRVARESVQSDFVTPLTGTFPVWWRLLRWLIIGFCISDPLAHCVWLTLQTEAVDGRGGKKKSKENREKKRSDGVNIFEEFYIVNNGSTWWRYPFTLPGLRPLLEAFYRLKRKSQPLSVSSSLAVAFLTCELAQLALVFISPVTVGTWLGHTMGSRKKKCCGDDDDDELQLFFSLLFSWMYADTVTPVRSSTHVNNAFFHEALLISLSILRLLHDASPLLGALRDDLRLVGMNSNSVVAGAGALCLWKFNVPRMTIQMNEECQAAVMKAIVDAVGLRGMKGQDRPTSSFFRGLGSVEKTEVISTLHDKAPVVDMQRRRSPGKMPVEMAVRLLRNTWPKEDVTYPLDWRSAWTEQDEAQFIARVHRTIQRYEDEEFLLCEQCYGEEALRRFVPSTRAYIVMQPGYTEADAELEMIYRDLADESDLAPL